MADAETERDDCKICDIVMITAGLVIAGILAYMAIDLATDGRLSSVLGKTVPLASVTDIAGQRADDSDAG